MAVPIPFTAGSARRCMSRMGQPAPSPCTVSAACSTVCLVRTTVAPARWHRRTAQTVDTLVRRDSQIEIIHPGHRARMMTRAINRGGHCRAHEPVGEWPDRRPTRGFRWRRANERRRCNGESAGERPNQTLPPPQNRHRASNATRRSPAHRIQLRSIFLCKRAFYQRCSTVRFNPGSRLISSSRNGKRSQALRAYRATGAAP